MKIGAILSLFLFSNCFAQDTVNDKTTEKFQQDCLKATNNYRAKHNAPPLILDEGIVKFVKTRCELISQNPDMQNGDKPPEDPAYGENIYYSSHNDFDDCNKVIDIWYSGHKKYDYEKAKLIPGSGQFTQLVWAGTASVGCALCGSKGSKGFTTIAVCDYDPAGNFDGEYKDNVLKL